MSINPYLQKVVNFQHKPVLVLILINIVLGLITFRDYGFSLDEPLFYGYADSLGYAYSPAEWLSGDFQLYRAFGPSAWDHANRGPAYLLLARGPAHLLQAMGLDQASAWHLVNFLAFQFGIYFFYVLCRRWMQPWAAFTATALFATQPVLWEHAFINPKDPPFLVFFLITLELGFRMADQLTSMNDQASFRTALKRVLLPGIMLGLTTSTRILGPLAGVLVILYFLLLQKPARLWWIIPYGLVAILAMIITWPLLWEGPVTKFINTVKFMMNNPTVLNVFFYGRIYRADDLPLRYLPVMFLITLTEPLWPLALAGGFFAFLRLRNDNLQWKSLLASALWFVIPFGYVLWKHPPMYDGFRHFMFILPPVFVFAGLAVEAFFNRVENGALRVIVIFFLLFPGIFGSLRLHPYEYTYYNQFVGGTDKASYRYEMDYWLTCYKEVFEIFNPPAGQTRVLIVPREGYIAAYYANDNVQIIDASAGPHVIQPGDYFLVASRASKNVQRYRNQNEFTLIKRDNAIFCAIGKYSEK